MPRVLTARERLILRACGVSSAFIVNALLLSFELEPVGSSIVAGIAGFMFWVAARAVLVGPRQRERDWT